MSHFSLHPYDDLRTLFTKMFSNSKIAEKFQLEKDKCGYLVNYGLAPCYFS